MTVFLNVLEELRKALDNEKLCLNKRSELRTVNQSPSMPASECFNRAEIIEVIDCSNIVIESIKHDRRMVGGGFYQTYECSEKTFTPEQCKELHEFLDGYEQACSLLDRLKKINGG